MTAAAWVLAFTFATSAQQTLPRAGRLTEGVACRADPTQTYTLYLPAQYDPSRRWPLLLVFDPRGRGTLAAQVFLEAAEAHGWIIVSSNNTRSDGPWEPNGRALAALWPSVLQEYSVDPRRIYAAGFSGGAGVAWVLAHRSSAIAGIIAVGAPARKDIDPSGARFAWFGSAGRSDFNFLDARALDDRMAAAGVSHRLEFFEGTHQWMTANVARLAVGWLEALAMKGGLRTRDEALAARLAGDESARVGELESAGRLVEARQSLSVLVETFTGLADVSAARRRLEQLDVAEALARARKDERKHDDWEKAQRAAAGPIVAQLRADDPPHTQQLIQALNVSSLRQRARRTGYEGEAAQRVLENIFVQTAFYVPQALEERREFARAATSLEVATAVHPDRPNVWFGLAAARAQSSARKEALAALKMAIELGFKNRDALESDARFASLRGTEEYTQLLQRIARP